MEMGMEMTGLGQFDNERDPKRAAFEHRAI